MRRRVVFAKPVAALLVLGACATPTIVSEETAVAARVPFLRPGATGRREAFARLGDPARRHDADGVFVWEAGEDQDGRLRILDEAAKAIPSRVPWTSARFELVLQFDPAGRYVRGSLVRAE